MTASRSELDAESWAFALAIYAKPRVAAACLLLQNEAGVDVMTLLMVTFAAARLGVALTAVEIRQLDDACRPWRERIIRPLRAVRTELKTGPSPAPSDETEQLRSQIKAFELAAERLQNKLLAESLPLGEPKKDAVNAAQLRAVVTSVVMHFAERRVESPSDRVLSSIDVIVEAARQDPS